MKVPVYGLRGGINIPVKPHREFPDAKLCESKIVRKDGRYIAMLTSKFEAPPMRKCPSILAVDLGERFAATTVLWRKGAVKAQFLGREVEHPQTLNMAPRKASREWSDPSRKECWLQGTEGGQRRPPPSQQIDSQPCS
ncbi:MAG: hypothetical protein KIH01_09510 [Candidatus Freyarchaeota archaeon]|nr:hypothetical protein [Candidatus Jordarchaeia archaeon]